MKFSLHVFVKLKGLNKAHTFEEIERMLGALDLQDKRDVLSRDLSGGMKRKLSVGIAFLAGSKVLIISVLNFKL